MKQTPSLRIMQIIHLAFCGGVLLFGIVVSLLIAPYASFSIAFNVGQPITFIAPIFALGGVFLSNFIFNKILGDVYSQELPEHAKLVRYQTSLLIKCALLEAPAWFNIVASLITNNMFFLIFGVLCLVVLWLSRPTKEKVYDTLKIQESDLF